MSELPLQIAIDGPVASGKGDIAARLASTFHLLYVYTGAMYRALALLCIQSGVPLKDESAVLSLLKKHSIAMSQPPVGSFYPYHITLNGVDVTERITHQDTAQGASDVGSLKAVRAWMVDVQKQIAKDNRVVMEGRDIALRVLPFAQLKIYLTASVEARAKRRYAQWLEKGIQKTFEETLEDTKIRDQQDMNRAVDPLQKMPDAWELDTTEMTQDQVIDTIKRELQKRGCI